jgi:hypothetical protein
LLSEAHPALLCRTTGPVTSGQVTVIIYGHFASKEDLMLSAMEAAPVPDHSATLNDQSRPLRERLTAYGRVVFAEEPGDQEEVAVILEFYAALLRAPDAPQRFSARDEVRGGERKASKALSRTAPGDSHPPAVSPPQPAVSGKFSACPFNRSRFGL